MLIPYDIDDDGRLDIIVQSNEKGNFEMEVIYNNYVFDSFFIKAMMLS